MTQEEKAKAYDEALERARDVYTYYCDDREQLRKIESIFPELKESEDERIRKDLIEYFKWNVKQILNDFSNKECIAWLEKQKPIQNINKEDEEVRQYIVRIMEQRDINVPMVQKALAWLEKQGEQKEPQVYKTEDGEIITYSETDGYKFAEPKFKVGDWVAYNHNPNLPPRKIIQITNEHYIFNNGSFETKALEADWHLWTIQDAKDGDVLVNGSNIFIFHFINDTRLMGYCHVNLDDGRFYDDIGKNECFCLIDAVVTPATKEQRDILFQKMKEAGYEWDDEKKELKLLITNGGDFEAENCEQNKILLGVKRMI